MPASYVISVRQASALPAASFRFHLAMDTLAVRLTVPLTGSVGDFHSQVDAPCRAHELIKATEQVHGLFLVYCSATTAGNCSSGTLQTLQLEQ